MSEPCILCPVCRIAVPDRDYYRHAKTHQAPRPDARTAKLPQDDE